uniref:Odorant receptor n=1 Tax=Athetis lepigone TaxID=1223490 RepID=A0A1B3B768_ATHLE|nr:putative odorant receptor OR57 [Athetis lepigone]
MRLLKYIWRTITQSRAIEIAGPLERRFFESVYRLVFIFGLSTSDDNLRYMMYSGSIMVMCSMQITLEIWHVLYEDLALNDIISSANVIFIHFITTWKLMMMMSNKRIFKKLAKALESPSFDISTQRRKNIVNYWANTHKKYLKWLLSIAHLTLFVWHTFPLIDDVEYNLMVDIKIPFDYDRPLRYVLIYFGVGIMFHYTSMMVVMTEVIMQAYLIPLICQFNVLADCFENIFEECALEFQASFPEINKQELVKNNIFVKKYLKRLGDLVTQHKAILDQTMELKSILSAPMLGQLACSGLLNCFVGFQATATVAENLGKFAMSLLYLSYNMFTLYLICRWCEEITLQSQHIGQSAYFSGWESGISQAPGARASFILIIARSNKPLVFLAGGTYPLSLSSYTNLVKTSYSALNILLTMSHE